MISMFMMHNNLQETSILKLNLTFNIDDAFEYLNILEKDFNHLSWVYRRDHNEPDMIDPKNNMDIVKGWGLQTIYDDLDFPYHCDLDPHNEGPKHFKDTPMVFGFFKRFKDMLKEPFRSFLFVWPSKQYIGKWMSHSPPHVFVGLVLQTNKDCYAYSYESGEKVLLEAGNIYLLDTTQHPAELINDGEEDLIFIVSSVPVKYKQDLINLKGVI